MPPVRRRRPVAIIMWQHPTDPAVHIVAASQSCRARLNGRCAAWQDVVVGIGYRLDTAQGLTLVVWDDDVTADESTSYVMRLSADFDWPPGLLHLTDLTTAGEVVAPDRDLLGELVAGHDPFRMAIIAPAASGVASRFEHAAASIGSNAVMFDGLRAACAWLGIDDAATRVTLDAIRHDLQQGRTLAV
jgi:hypothetical protein